MIFRFGVVPAFLFSGAFFPVSQLPNWIEWLAYVSPLWHGGRAVAATSAWARSIRGWRSVNLAYLLAWFLVGTWLAVRGFTRKLIG